MNTESPWSKSLLSIKEIEYLLRTFQSTEHLIEVILFGSRSLGTARTGSDIDLAIKSNPGSLSSDTARKLSVHLNESTNLPYRFDVLALDTLTHSGILEHIQKHGRTVWKLI